MLGFSLMGFSLMAKWHSIDMRGGQWLESSITDKSSQSLHV